MLCIFVGDMAVGANGPAVAGYDDLDIVLRSLRLIDCVEMGMVGKRGHSMAILSIH